MNNAKKVFPSRDLPPVPRGVKTLNNAKISDWGGSNLTYLIQEVYGYKAVNTLSGGRMGLVLSAERIGGAPTSRRRIFKVVEHTDAPAYLEARYNQVFADAGLALHPLDILFYRFRGTEYVIIVMEEIDGVINDAIRNCTSIDEVQKITDAIDDLISRAAKYSLIHGDLHDNNLAYITCSSVIKPVLIDFGWSTVDRTPSQEFAGKIDILKLIYAAAYDLSKKPKSLGRYGDEYYLGLKKIVDKQLGRRTTPSSLPALRLKYFDGLFRPLAYRYTKQYAPGKLGYGIEQMKKDRSDVVNGMPIENITYVMRKINSP